MYGIFTYIWLNFMVNVGKYTSPMDPLGTPSITWVDLLGPNSILPIFLGLQQEAGEKSSIYRRGFPPPFSTEAC